MVVNIFLPFLLTGEKVIPLGDASQRPLRFPIITAPLISANAQVFMLELAGSAALFATFVVALFLPATAGESTGLKFSADLAHMLAFPLGWLSAKIRLKK
jgi:hypothetical protein